MESILKKSITVAMFQGCAEDGNLQSNVQKIKNKMVEAKKMSVDVIVFPELYATGYNISYDCMRELAEKSSGRTFMELSQCAKEVGIAVLYGYAELVEEPAEEKVYYNSIQFIDKDGKSLANYRKTHPWVEEHNIEGAFKAGESFSLVFDFCGVKIGLLICFDVEFCEAVRTLALQGAEVILVPTACTAEYNIRFRSEVLLPCRAFENRIHVAYVNHCGGKFSGMSCCCGPLGNTLVSAGTEEEGIFLAQIDTCIKGTSYDNYSYIAHRRPDLYRYTS